MAVRSPRYLLHPDLLNMPATIPLLQEGRYTLEQEFPYVENCFLFQAHDTQKDDAVTIVEVPLSHTKGGSNQTDQFTEQAERLVLFRHNSVVSVRSYFSEGGRNYLVLDPIDGVDLGTVLGDQTRTITIADMAGWADNVLDALNLMHQSRPPMAFSNLRPENIFLRADGTAALLPAGMLYRSSRTPGSSAGVSAGNSPIAFSPLEQIWSGLDAASQKVIISKYDEASERTLKQGLDARSDLFSLGATLYKLMTGRTPADALERSIEMIEGNPDPLVSPNKVDAAIPFEISDVIMKAMEIRREYRFDSAAIMRQVLKTALVRVREREAEESLVKTVEGHDVSGVLQNAPAKPAPAVVKKPEAPKVEQPPVVQKPIAEAKPAEPAQPARKTETFTLADLDDDLLGLLSPSQHISESRQTITVEAPKAAEPPKLETVPVIVDPVEPVSTASEPVEPEPVEQLPVESEQVEPVQFEPEPVEDQPVVTAATEQEVPVAATPVKPVLTESPQEPEASHAAEAEVPAEETETVPAEKVLTAAASYYHGGSEAPAGQKASGGIGLPAIAAAAAVLVIAAVGAWYFLGSGPTPASVAEPPAATQTAPPVEAPVQNLQSTEPSSAETTLPQSVSEQPPTTEPSAVKPVTETGEAPNAASVVTPKTKKPAPTQARTPAPKKAVTVDDLINDN